MLYYAAVFLILAIIAAVFGFGGVDAYIESLARILFYIFLTAFLLTFIFGIRDVPTWKD